MGLPIFTSYTVRDENELVGSCKRPGDCIKAHNATTGRRRSLFTRSKIHRGGSCSRLHQPLPSAANAVFGAVLPGDPGEITGSSQQLETNDGAYFDWTAPWDTWVTKSAVHK
jgi:hypothetical protein